MMNSTTVIAKIKEMQQPSFFNVQKKKSINNPIKNAIQPCTNHNHDNNTSLFLS